MKEFFDLMFDTGDGVCVGDAKATKVYVYGVDRLPEDANFFCINPLDASYDHEHFKKEFYSAEVGRRADINVSTLRSFLFEMDGIPLEDQLNIFNFCSVPITSIVYSGGKSYHAIVKVVPCLELDPHNPESVIKYKHMWRRMAARIDMDARAMGYVYPDGASSFVDQSCKNPSRLSRIPGVLRDGKGLQDIVQLNEEVTLKNFKKLIDSCPEVKYSVRTIECKSEKEIDNMQDLEIALDPGLKRILKIVDWASDHNMYPLIYRYTAWAIDCSNVTKECFIEYLEKYTFPGLVRRGYPVYKLRVAVDDAFREKRGY